MTNIVLLDFSDTNSIDRCTVVNDVVMGGRSEAIFYMEKDIAVFEGDVSLENYGGFSSFRCELDQQDVSNFSGIMLRLKGDGKRYQFRCKNNTYDRHSYIAYFETSGEWEDVIIPFDKLYASFRGQRLDMQGFNPNQLEELGILIANNVNESFHLEIKEFSLVK